MPLVVSAHTYGAEAQNALVEAIDRLKRGGDRYDPLAPVTIVVPSSQSGYHIRRWLGRRAGGIVNVQIRPLLALLELIGSTALTTAGRRPLPEVRRSEAIRAVAEAGPPVFGDVPVDGGVLQVLTQRFREFDQCGREQLDLIARQGDLPAYLVGRYDAYQEEIQRFYTERDLAIAATDALQRRPGLLRDIGSVVLFLPGDLTDAERGFLDALSRHSEVQVLLGLSGDVETVDRHTLRSWDIDPDRVQERKPTAQRIVQAPDAEEEVRSAIREIAASLHAADPTPLHRTAIVYRQAEPYQRICAEQLDAAGIAWNGRNSLTLGQSIAGRTLDGLLRLISGSPIGWANDVAPWLAAAPIRDGDGQLAPTARWNQLARRANLLRGADDWTARLERYRATLRGDLERLQRTADDSKPGRLPWVQAEIAQIGDLTEFATQLAQFVGETPPEAPWSEYASQVRRQLVRLLGSREIFAKQASGDDDLELARWDDVQTLLDELSWLDDLSQSTAERFVAAARRGLARPTGHHNRIGDGVYVGPLKSAVGMQWDVLYIVGAAEKSLPETRSEDPLLADQLRAQVSLPGAADHMRRERSDYLAALHSATRRVLSYPRADMRAQRANLPGRWLLESATTLNGGERVYASKIDQASQAVVEATASFESAVRSSSMPADRQEFDLRSIRSVDWPDRHFLSDLCPALGRGFEQRDQRWRRELTRWDGLIAGGASEVTAQPHSASALQDWATCPYRYFLGRVLRIEERDEARDELQITAMDKGSLIHEILDEFFQEGSAQPRPGEHWPDSDRRRLEAIATRKLDEANQRGITGRELLWRRDRRRILNDLQTLLVQDDERRAAGHSQQIASELVFGALPDSQTDAELRLGDGSVLQLRGMIDRVDRSAQSGRVIVIDYKTGSEFPKGSELRNDPLVGGRFLQLPVYAHAARRVYGLAHDETVDSAYWYISERGEFKYNPVEWNPEKTAGFARAVNLIVDHVRSGRFPANPGGEDHRARGAHCAFCSFDAICPADRRRHWDRIKLAPELADYVELSEGPDEEASEA
jgi:hypothetical protein